MPTEANVSIREAIRSGMTTPSPEPTPKEASSPEPPGREEQTDGIGAYDPKLVEDLQADLSTLSPEQRKVIEPLVAKFRKPYDKAFHRAMSEIAELKRTMEAKPAAPPAEQVKEANTTLRGLHRRMEAATDPAVKESIREGIKDIEETIEDVVERIVSPKLKPLTDRLEGMETTETGKRVAEASAELDEMEDENVLPASFVEKHRRLILGAAAQYPNVPLTEIIVKIVPWADVQPVVLKLSHPTPSGKPEQAEGESPPAKALEKERVVKKPGSVSGMPEVNAIAKFVEKDGTLTKSGIIGLIKSGLKGR